MATISHALLVSPEEADALLAGRSHAVHRGRPTELRMRVGLLRSDGILVATAQLADASRPGEGSSVSEWSLRELEALQRPINIGAGEGPLWKRLGGPDRDRVSGRGALDDDGEADQARRNVGHQTPLSRADPTEALGAEINSIDTEPLRSNDVAPEEDVFDVAFELEPDFRAGYKLMPLEHDLTEVNEENEVAGEPDTIEEGSLSVGDGDLSDARRRAFAFVPKGMIDVDEAHRLLIRMRDLEIKPTFADVRPEHGILRRTMLQALLDTGVASMEDYDDLIPTDLKRMTDRRQIEVYLDPIIELLSRVA